MRRNSRQHGLDTPPDGAFDRITTIVAQELRVPIALVSIVDHDIWFKSRQGIDVDEIGRDPGLCASCIMQDGPWVVTDPRKDARTLANPLVAGTFGLQFYLDDRLLRNRARQKKLAVPVTGILSSGYRNAQLGTTSRKFWVTSLLPAGARPIVLARTGAASDRMRR